MAFVVAIIGAAVAVVAAGVGTYEQVQARNRAADEANAVEDQKQKEAVAAQQSAAFAEQQHRRRIALLAGKQEAITGASGVSLASGSSVFADIDLATQGELEALNIRRGGQVESEAKTFEARLAHYRAETQRGLIPYDIAQGTLTAASAATTSYSEYKGYNRYRSPTFTSFSS